jgi:hypothetical protein
VKYFKVILLILLIGNLTGCKNPASNSPLPKEEGHNQTDTLLLSNKQLVIQWGENEVPVRIFPLNDSDIQDGYSVSYGGDGELSTVSRWKQGLKDGNSFSFDEGLLQTHQVFDRNQLIYEGRYENKLKTGTLLFPKFVEEFFFEDKYYAKIRFPLAYQGDFDFQVKGFQTVVTPLLDQTFQLVINDALDLVSYELQLTYHAAAGDTLIRSEYTLRHVVYED